jgi:hypothetical protein
VQLCVNLEEERALRAGCTYLNLHPAHPLLSLSAAAKPQSLALAVTCNGVPCGSASAADVIEVLVHLRARFESCDLVVHALHGHSPEVLEELYRRVAPERCLWWVHDFFAVCPNHMLLRNAVKPCGAPPPDSAACGICAFGEERLTHLKRLRALFSAVPFTGVAPSAFAAEYLETRGDGLLKASIVQPHCVIERDAGDAAHEAIDRSGAVRVAFLGHAAAHKGWTTFIGLVDAFGHDEAYAFHHLGAGTRMHRRTHFTPVSVLEDGPNAMVDALRAQLIDAVVLWSLSPETFSFVAHEALAANALILTGEQSGNVARMAREHGGGVFRDEEALLRAFADGTIAQLIRRHRAERSRPGRLIFSGMSVSVLGHALTPA